MITDFLNRKQHTLKCRQSGFALVEIIVSMLIMSIVVVPLLTNFSVTARTNVKAREIKESSDFAQQILENLQAYDADDVDSFFSGHEPFSLVQIASDGSFGRTNNTFETGGSLELEEKKAEDGAPRYYFILGAESSSGKEYDIKISYDPTPFSTGSTQVSSYNLQEFPDVSVFSSAETAFVNPNDAFVSFKVIDGKFVFDDDKGKYQSELSSSYEKIVIDSFYERHMAFLTTVIEEVNDILYNKNVCVDDYLKVSDFTGGLSNYETEKKASLRACTSRNTMLKLKKDEDGQGVYLTGYLQYVCETESKVVDSENTKTKIKNKSYENDEGGTITLEASEVDALVDSIAEKIKGTDSDGISRNLQPSYKVFYNAASYEKLSDIYLMYMPLSNKFKSDTVSLDLEDAADLYSKEDRLGLYLIPQFGLTDEVHEVWASYKHPEIKGIKVDETVFDSEENQNTAGEGIDGGTDLDVETSKIPFGKVRIRFYRDEQNYLWISETGDFASLVGSDGNNQIVQSKTDDLIYSIKVEVYKRGLLSSWDTKLTELSVTGK